MRRPFGVRLLAALLALYAMAGVLLAAAMLAGRDTRFNWVALAAAAALFAGSAGAAALAAWRLERRAPAWALACGVCGAALALVLPAAAPPPAGGGGRDAWTAAATGAALFLAFLVAVAAYLRRRIRAHEP